MTAGSRDLTVGLPPVLAMERGSAAVEFALLLPALIFVLVAMAEVTVVARTQLELTHAAREGARVAATTPDPASAVDAVHQVLGAGLAGRASVSVERPSVVGRPARVEIVLPHTIPVFGWSFDLIARSVMRVE